MVELISGFGSAIFVGLLSIVFLILSSEFVVRKLIALAHHYGFSNMFVGLTVLSVGTSLPEIGSHIVASLGILSGKLNYGIASATVLGANIGSDVVQQTLVLGVVILIAGSVTFSTSFLKKSYSVMIATTLITLLLGLDGVISRFDGFILVSLFVAYMIFLYRTDSVGSVERKPLKHTPLVEVSLMLAGMAVLLGSSIFALRSTEFMVLNTGISGSMIGVVTLGVASALPEMFTALVGLRRNAKGISLGALIGSNITNPLLAIGIGGLISTYFVPKPLVYWDLPMETITAALLLGWLFLTKRKLNRWGGVYLVCLYVFYLVVRILFFAVD